MKHSVVRWIALLRWRSLPAACFNGKRGILCFPKCTLLKRVPSWNVNGIRWHTDNSFSRCAQMHRVFNTLVFRHIFELYEEGVKFIYIRGRPFLIKATDVNTCGAVLKKVSRSSSAKCHYDPLHSNLIGGLDGSEDMQVQNWSCCVGAAARRWDGNWIEVRMDSLGNIEACVIWVSADQGTCEFSLWKSLQFFPHTTYF